MCSSHVCKYVHFTKSITLALKCVYQSISDRNEHLSFRIFLLIFFGINRICQRIFSRRFRGQLKERKTFAYFTSTKRAKRYMIEAKELLSTIAIGEFDLYIVKEPYPGSMQSNNYRPKTRSSLIFTLIFLLSYEKRSDGYQIRAFKICGRSGQIKSIDSEKC